MQPTDTQVQRSLDALRTGEIDPQEVREARSTAEIDLAELPEGLLDELRDGVGVRPDRLADAQERMAAGTQPSADDLAGRMVGRLVCDRLR
jgi:hypothetical protein